MICDGGYVDGDDQMNFDCCTWYWDVLSFHIVVVGKQPWLLNRTVHEKQS